MYHVSLGLGALLQAPNRPDWLRCGASNWSSHAVANGVAALSHALSQRLQVLPGDRIILLGASSDHFIMALLACMDAGAVAVPLNTRWSGREVADAVQRCAPRVIMADAQHLHLLQDVTGASGPRPHLVLLGHGVGGSQQPGAHSAFYTTTMQLMAETSSQQSATAGPPAQLQLLSTADGAALVCFTSGTTGRPKGVVLSHSNFHCQSLAKLACVGYCQQDVYLHLAPLFHIGGLSSLMAVIMAGGSHIVMPKFDAAAALHTISTAGVTTFIAVPTMVLDMAAAAHRHSHSVWPSVLRILVGAGGTSAKMQAMLSSMFPNAALHSAYGMSEACSSITFRTLRRAEMPSALAPASAQARRASHDAREGGSQPARGLLLDLQSAPAGAWGGSCAGLPAPGVEVRVIIGDERLRADAATCTSNTSSNSDHMERVGEVWTRGPHVMLGYWQDAQETQKVLASGGWLQTGDLGYFDADGQLWLLGRAKDMVKTGGENVFAPEVEAVLCSHPDVLAAAVVGAPDERLGEKVAAVVVLRPGTPWSGLTLPESHGGAALPGSSVPQVEGAQPTTSARSSQATVSPDALQSWCRSSGLAGFKLPRVIAAQWQPLPVNASGKLVKHVVKQTLLQALGVRDGLHSRL